jgi:hypothetical protein
VGAGTSYFRNDNQCRLIAAQAHFACEVKGVSPAAAKVGHRQDPTTAKAPAFASGLLRLWRPRDEQRRAGTERDNQRTLIAAQAHLRAAQVKGVSPAAAKVGHRQHPMQTEQPGLDEVGLFCLRGCWAVKTKQVV